MITKAMKRNVLYAVTGVMLFTLFCCTTPLPDKEMSITSSSDEAVELFLEGRDYWETLQNDKAAEMFDKAIEIDPDFAMAYFYRATSGGGGDVYRYNLNKAISLMDQVSDGEQVFLKIFMNLRDGNGEAMNLYADSLLTMFPEDKRVPYMIGIWNLNGDIEENNALLKKAVQLDESYPAPYSALADNYSFLKEFEQAEKFAQKYMELLPDKAYPYQILGTLYRQQGKLDQAIEMYLKMLEMDPESGPYIFIGNCYTFMGDYQKARENYLMSYELNKQIDMKLSSLFNYSISYIFEGDMEGALEAMEKYREEAEKANITTSVIYSHLYQVAITWAFEDYDVSEVFLNKAVEMIETSELDQTVRDNFERNLNAWRGYLLIGKGELETAREYIDTYKTQAEERNMQSEIKNANFYYALIAIHQGDYETALSYLEKSGDNYQEWYYLGEAYEGLGDIDKAKEYYEKIATSYLLNISLAFVRDKAIKKLEEI